VNSVARTTLRVSGESRTQLEMGGPLEKAQLMDAEKDVWGGI